MCRQGDQVSLLCADQEIKSSVHYVQTGKSSQSIMCKQGDQVSPMVANKGQISPLCAEIGRSILADAEVRSVHCVQAGRYD